LDLAWATVPNGSIYAQEHESKHVKIIIITFIKKTVPQPIRKESGFMERNETERKENFKVMKRNGIPVTRKRNFSETIKTKIK
jgi:hypothetical protein